MTQDFAIRIDRQAGIPLADQIGGAIGDAIRDGRLAPGARLPSWNDLAAQLGVARGTVRLAYELLRDQQLVFTAGAAGTRVVSPAPGMQAPAGALTPPRALLAPSGPMPFQVGVPAQDVFPSKTWARVLGRAARAAASAPPVPPDPRGEAVLRAEIAAYLGIARGLRCAPSQVFVTNGFGGALDLVLRSLRLGGSEAWVEDPGYAVARAMLAQHGVRPVAVRVDAEGLDVAAGMAAAPGAALAIVTPGQQAPLGMTLPLRRRHALLDWAATAGAYVVEDDYLGELQLQGRATPALAWLDSAGRVLHAGTFNKTIHPGLRVGFLVVPDALVARIDETAAVHAVTPPPMAQLALAEFMRSGHYLRHLRRMKRVYAERRQALASCLRGLGLAPVEAGLSVLLPLATGCDDGRLAQQARAAGLAPSALSWWRAGAREDALAGPAGLLLGVANLPEEGMAAACRRLAALLATWPALRNA